MFKAYYRLTKPGIIYGNLLTATGGFLLASQRDIDPWLMLALLAGTSLVIGSACVFNNYIDRGIDKKMARTKLRPLISGQIKGSHALVYGLALGVAGFTILGLWTNWLTFLVGAIGFVDYLVFYSIWKRRSTLGTLVGSIAGATPVTAGYTAVTGVFDTGALLVFLVLVFWQMPHFYAIAIRRRKDYAMARLPVLPVEKNILTAKKHIIFYIALFIVATVLLTIAGYTGFVYLGIMAFFGLRWLWLGFQGFAVKDTDRWALRMFMLSLGVILGFSIAISLDAWLP